MLNHIDIMGRLTRDPEHRQTSNGKSVTNFALAVERDFKGADGNKETDFIEVVAWGKTAEFVSRYFTKGAAAIVSGRLQMRSWTDKDGNKRTAAEVSADSVYFAERKKDGGNTEPYPAPKIDYSASSGFEMLEDNEEPLPF